MLHGLDSLALLAAGAPGDTAVAAALTGGHGELFVRQFDRAPLHAAGPVRNLPPAAAAAAIDAPLVSGSGAGALVAARGWGEALDLLPQAAAALRLPDELRTLPPRPIYGRAPDARAKAA
jgi:hypothetical protein